jgi:hypothetical protein
MNKSQQIGTSGRRILGCARMLTNGADGDGRLSLVEVVHGIWTIGGGRVGEADLGGWR